MHIPVFGLLRPFFSFVLKSHQIFPPIQRLLSRPPRNTYFVHNKLNFTHHRGIGWFASHEVIANFPSSDAWRNANVSMNLSLNTRAQPCMACFEQIECIDESVFWHRSRKHMPICMLRSRPSSVVVLILLLCTFSVCRGYKNASIPQEIQEFIALLFSLPAQQASTGEQSNNRQHERNLRFGYA